MRHAAALLALAVAVVCVFGRALGHDFVEFDDPLYITENPGLAHGLSPAGVSWAFTTDQAFLWHPLTWLTYLAEAELFGIGSATPFVVTQLVLHAGAVALLYLFLLQATGQAVAAFFVALLFAVHPLQVESVVWVSARKEVLAGLLAMGTLWAHAALAQRPTLGRQAVVAIAFALCLAAKGTLITLPLVLLLLDRWPLRRTEPLRQLVIEKLPLVGVAALVLLLQFRAVAVAVPLAGPDPPLLERVPITIMAFAGTLGRLLWPTGLSIAYPTPLQMGLGPYPIGQVLAAFGILAAVTAACLAAWRRAPWLAVGWLWFALLLGPMSGLAPAGLRVMHDRYAYVPLVGVAIALAFSVEALPRDAWRRLGRGALAAAAGLCAVLAYQQAGVWSDSFRLFDHAIAVEPRNAIAHFSRGIAFAKSGDVPHALEDLRRAVALQPEHADAHMGLGYLLQQGGDAEAALPHLERGAALRPGSPLAHSNLGKALEALGREAEALAAFQTSVRVGPPSADAHYWLAVALHRRGRGSEARAELERALEIDPTHPWSQRALGRAP